MTDKPSLSRTATRQRITLIVPADATPPVLAFAKQLQDLLGGTFAVRLESDDEVTPVESRMSNFPFMLKILG
jgi:hypothetical protein